MMSLTAAVYSWERNISLGCSMSGTLPCLVVLYDDPDSISLQLGGNILLGCTMSGTLTCLVVMYNEPDSSSLQLGEEYLAGMLYERDSHLSYRAVL
jgi:hypothetical protein